MMYCSAHATTHFLLWQQKLLVWTFTSTSPAVLMYDFTFSAPVQRERWQPWAHWFMKDKADAMCPTVRTVKKRARPAFHLGHASCVDDCICMSLFYQFLSWVTAAELWGWCEVTSAWQWGLWDSVGIPHFVLLLPLIEKHNLLRLGCESKKENTVTHRAAVISRGEREAVVCSGIIWIWWYGFSLANFSAVVS